jgi:hypothetical protein
MDHSVKRARTEQQECAGSFATSDSPTPLPSIGREQLLVTSLELSNKLGKKFFDERELLALLLSHGIVRRVRTIGVEVHPLGGDSFKITLDANNLSVSEAKAAIELESGKPEHLQELFKVELSADGSAIREDDSEPVLLGNEDCLEPGMVICLSVKSEPVLWEKHDTSSVTVSEDGTLVTKLANDFSWDLVTSAVELTDGKHYWEVEICSNVTNNFMVGVTRPNLDPHSSHYYRESCTDAWLMDVFDGGRNGNGYCDQDDDAVGM